MWLCSIIKIRLQERKTRFLFIPAFDKVFELDQQTFFLSQYCFYTSKLHSDTLLTGPESLVWLQRCQNKHLSSGLSIWWLTFPAFDSLCRHSTAETSFLVDDGHLSAMSSAQGDSGAVILALARWIIKSVPRINIFKSIIWGEVLYLVNNAKWLAVSPAGDWRGCFR